MYDTCFILCLCSINSLVPVPTQLVAVKRREEGDTERPRTNWRDSYLRKGVWLRIGKNDILY